MTGDPAPRDSLAGGPSRGAAATGPAPGEADRDNAETAFTAPLRALVRSAPEVLAVAFVDDEGECVDYCTSLSPFEAKIAGAQLLVLVKDVTQAFEGKAGVPNLIVVEATERCLIARRAGEGYTLAVVVAASPGITTALFVALEATLTALRVEAGIPRPDFERQKARLFADVRTSPWGYAPEALYDRGERIEVKDVLGRWTEDGGTAGRVCFLVRVGNGEEIVLRYDEVADVWER